jgi:hypothetical protein
MYSLNCSLWDVHIKRELIEGQDQCFDISARFFGVEENHTVEKTFPCTIPISANKHAVEW